MRHARALAEFRRVYPDRAPVNWRLKEHVLADGGFVQTICFGRTRPPSRSWWIFRHDEDSPEELSYEEAKALFEIPLWR